MVTLCGTVTENTLVAGHICSTVTEKSLLLVTLLSTVTEKSFVKGDVVLHGNGEGVCCGS